MNRQRLVAALFLVSGTLFLIAGWRDRGRSTWFVFGAIFVGMGLARLVRTLRR